MLLIRDLTVRLPARAERTHALRGVSFAVRNQEIVCVVGESGSGKSILARSIVGLNPPGIQVQGGSIKLGTTDMLSLSDFDRRQVRRRRVGMVFQDPMSSLNPLMPVGRQIYEAIPEEIERDAGRRWSLVYQAIEEVGLPEAGLVSASYPHRLSGGQRQRIMIAMATVRRPDLLIADEPTTALDVTTQAQVLRLLKDAQSRTGMAILFVTHDFGVVAEIADSVVVLRAGELVEQGKTDSILGNPCHGYVKELVAAVPRWSPRDILVTKGPEVLRAERLAKTYVRKESYFGKAYTTSALADVSVQVGKGEVLGIVGESGSGKSTLARVLCGLSRADSGSISINGGMKPGSPKNPVQMVFQDPYGSLNPTKTILQILSASPFFAGRTKRQMQEEAIGWLATVGLPSSALGRRPHEFSGGQRQRIAIARALSLCPDLLVADEPVSALDVSIQCQVLDLIRSVQRKLGFALVFITHDLMVAAQVCDRIIVMRRGAIVEEGLPNAILLNPQHDYTKALVAAMPGQRLFGPTCARSENSKVSTLRAAGATQ